MKTPLPVRLLSEMGRSGVTRRLRRANGVQRLARRTLFRSILTGEDVRPDDVTVLIGVRNRADHRLINALRTIRGQTHPAELVHPMVVDYGSDPSHARSTEEICSNWEADYVRADVDGPWSRARCLNIGIRLAQTTFLLTSDVDMVFSPAYVADAVTALRLAPLSVIGASMLDLPERSTEHFRRAAETGGAIDLHAWRAQTVRRFDLDFHPSLGMTYTAFYRLVRGYDEYFTVWGGEDRDLMARFASLGLEPLAVNKGSFYLHQWHPKFEGVDAGAESPVVTRNRAYLNRHHTILRNDETWGNDHPVALSGEAAP